MTHFSINGTIGFFDLSNRLIFPELEKDVCVLCCMLPDNIRIHVFNNCYYIFDFRKSTLTPFKEADSLDDFKEAARSINLHIQKEVINAFNACIYIAQGEQRKHIKRSSTISRLETQNDVDQFFIPNIISDQLPPFKSYLNHGTAFSSEAYRTACDHKYNCCKEDIGSIDVKYILEGIALLSSLLSENTKEVPYNQRWFYIIAYLWKSIHFKKHDLRIESVSFLRSVFEVLVKRTFEEGKELTATDYGNYCVDSKVSEIFMKFAGFRNSALHSLKIAESDKWLSGLDEYIVHIIKFFECDSGIVIQGINT